MMRSLLLITGYCIISAFMLELAICLWKSGKKTEAEEDRRRQEEARNAEIESSIDEGDLEKAEAIATAKADEIIIPYVAPVEKTTRTSAGSTTVKKDICVELVDKNMVVAAIITGELPFTLITFDIGAAKRYAKSVGATSLPGFKITETAVVSGRRL